LYAQPNGDSYDASIWDGKIFERYSQPQRLDGKLVGVELSGCHRASAGKKIRYQALHDLKPAYLTECCSMSGCLWHWQMLIDGRVASCDVYGFDLDDQRYLRSPLWRSVVARRCQTTERLSAGVTLLLVGEVMNLLAAT